jgi:hypothetical protein
MLFVLVGVDNKRPPKFHVYASSFGFPVELEAAEGVACDGECSKGIEMRKTTGEKFRSLILPLFFVFVRIVHDGNLIYIFFLVSFLLLFFF